MIRLAELSDIPELLRMGELFFNASGYAGITTFDIKTTTIVLNDLIKGGTLLTDGKHSMLGFVVFPVFMNANTKMSQELFWWVDESERGSGTGVEILKEAERISKEHGASVMAMLSLEDLNGKKVSKLYEKLGYIRKEQTYMRVI